ncbi:hypothetical protein EQG49_02890 [Periweissella cryptocerci]|uniref:Uncharacterized protein n=1 Tax=Periweissella cryptocerci TaxID=2506420 RepID=A0A4V1AIH0_9LACO|nr:hypothetical protein [Periweissella cryptocerci]QBO35475.1 hypothetical protein EQG49_02890 [Periweissella cryptocerci]
MGILANFKHRSASKMARQRTITSSNIQFGNAILQHDPVVIAEGTLATLLKPFADIHQQKSPVIGIAPSDFSEYELAPLYINELITKIGKSELYELLEEYVVIENNTAITFGFRPDVIKAGK